MHYYFVVYFMLLMCFYCVSFPENELFIEKYIQILQDEHIHFKFK